MTLETVQCDDIADAQWPLRARAYLDIHTTRLQDALMARVRNSAQAHRCYTTVRRENPQWLDVQQSHQARVLRCDAHFSVELWTLEPGMPMPWPRGTLAMEVLVVKGSLHHSVATETPELVPHGFLVSDKPVKMQSWTASVLTSVYIRRCLAPLEVIDPMEAQWWERAVTHQGPVQGRTWYPSTPGVQMIPLCGDKQVTSMLVRFEAGASVRDHGHALDEDCLVLEGDMFLGDVLLRSGDYQLAPAGSSHLGEMSDDGVTFYFHGALDPVLFLA
jgi:quercetin dioxygenase-like cupin family protein